MNETISINEDGLNKLILEVNDYNEKINSIINQIDDLIISSKDKFICEEADELFQKFSELDASKKNLTINLENYSNDLLKVKRKFKEISDLMTEEVKRHTERVENTNYIEEVK